MPRVDLPEPTPSRAGPKRGIGVAIGDFLATGWKFPLAAGLGVGSLVFQALIELFPNAGKDQDPGVFMLGGMFAPFALTAVALMVWQRRWRKARSAEAAALAPPAAARATFAGIPDPGGLPVGAITALDQDDPVGAIKVLRAERGLGLAEAKALVDAELARRGARR